MAFVFAAMTKFARCGSFEGLRVKIPGWIPGVGFVYKMAGPTKANQWYFKISRIVTHL
jgi:hypothetical protein